MTPITHKIEETGYELLIIGFKEHVKSIELSMSSNMLFYSRVGLPSKAVELPHVYDSLGLLSGITEEKLEGIMPKKVEYFRAIKLWQFKDYNDKHISYNTYVYDTALESFQSLLQKLEVYTVNPYGQNPENGENDEDKFWQHASKWQQAQQRVIKDAAVLFRKID